VPIVVIFILINAIVILIHWQFADTS